MFVVRQSARDRTNTQGREATMSFYNTARMGKQMGLLLVALVLFVLTGSVMASTRFTRRGTAFTKLTGQTGKPLTLHPEADAFVSSGHPSEPGTPIDQIFVGYDKLYGYAKERGLLRFDLRGIPEGAIIERATLRLWLASWQRPVGNWDPMDVHVYPIATPWDEETVTWNTKPGYDEVPLVNPVAVPPGPEQWIEFDVTRLVQEWVNGARPNHGFMLLGDESEGYHDRSFWSKECDPAKCGANREKQPQLVVEYFVPTPTPTPHLELKLQNDPSGSVDQGEFITYTIQYANPNAEILHNVVITGHIPINATYVPDSATPPATPEAQRRVLVWPAIATLAPGAEGQFFYRVQVATSTTMVRLIPRPSTAAAPKPISRSIPRPTPTPRLVVVGCAEGDSDETAPVQVCVFNGGWRVYLPLTGRGWGAQVQLLDDRDLTDSTPARGPSR